ncbi:sialidase family protein [Anatilimnocola floriformis]|uniref:sialidase family protein n=1 Tax=Anatilimnocola floriformis TaxID=2948575 RepID=UPI0020C39D7E|nr:sialidase family protein [Anatilimnocola floriformis]
MHRFLLAAICLAWCSVSSAADLPAGVVAEEFIYTEPPHPQCHASTIAETKDGLVAAWFGGTKEGANDVGIWFSKQTKVGWSKPVEVANGKDEEEKQLPCWNPVLFDMPATTARKGELLLFYKVGPSPSKWWGMLIRSSDQGQTWSEPEKLPEGILGPIKDKPVLLKDGTLLCPSSTEHKGWQVHIESTKDGGRTWQKTEPLCDGMTQHAIQPTILQTKSGLTILCRTRTPGKILQATSTDNGATWSKLEPMDLVNPNSGIDGVTLSDGRHLLVYNHTQKGRSPLNVAVSTDDGKTWQAAAVLETQPGEYSYPAVIQTSDGLVHITYTWKRQRVKHVTLEPAKLKLLPIVEGVWPK